MITEDYAGVCPNCNFDRLMRRHGGVGYFKYDACPNCGFAFGQDGDGKSMDEGEVWDIILMAEGAIIEHEGYARDILGFFQWILSKPEPERDKHDTVFVYCSKCNSTDVKRVNHAEPGKIANYLCNNCNQLFTVRR